MPAQIPQILEATVGIEPTMEVLQTSVPLGYVGVSEGRTRDLLLGKEALYH